MSILVANNFLHYMQLHHLSERMDYPQSLQRNRMALVLLLQRSLMVQFHLIFHYNNGVKAPTTHQNTGLDGKGDERLSGDQ